MLEPAVPANERQRLKTLRDLRLLDTPPEERFDRVTRLARQVFGTKIALVSLVDSDRQWFKSKQGLDVDETPRNVSFCGHAILDDRIMVVNDASADERFCDNPLVCGDPNIRFYAGYPLAAPDGSRVGTLCVIDEKPREISDEQLRLLRELGRMVEEELIAANQATTDPVTGLSSRNGFGIIAEHLLAMCKRCDQPATLLLCHHANAQQIDSQFGQDATEAAAVELSHLLTAGFRASDIVGRICIDVFAVLLAGTDLEGAEPARRRLDEQLSARNRETGLDYELQVDVYPVAYKPGRHAGADALIADGEARFVDAHRDEVLAEAV